MRQQPAVFSGSEQLFFSERKPGSLSRPGHILFHGRRTAGAHDPTGLAQANLRNQPLEAISVAAGRTRLAEVIVGDVSALARPAKENSPPDQAVLLFWPELTSGPFL